MNLIFVFAYPNLPNLYQPCKTETSSWRMEGIRANNDGGTTLSVTGQGAAVWNCVGGRQGQVMIHKLGKDCEQLGKPEMQKVSE